MSLKEKVLGYVLKYFVKEVAGGSKLKPGFLSTEFWYSIVTVVIVLLGPKLGLTQEAASSWITQVAQALAAAATAIYYIRKRSNLKETEIKTNGNGTTATTQSK